MAVLDADLGEIPWQRWRDDPSPIYRELRDLHPVFHEPSRSLYLVTRYDDVELVLKDSQRFSSVAANIVGKNRISPLRQEDPPKHGFLRKIVMPLFRPNEMRRLQGYFDELAKDLLDEAEKSDVVEVSSQLAVPLPGRVTCDILGVPLDQHKRFYELTAEREDLIHMADGRFADDGSRRSLAEIQDDLWGIVGPVVEARRREPRHDATTLLVQAQEEHGRDAISDELIVDMLLHLLTGGFHTTQHLVESMTSYLSDNPATWQRMRADRSLVPKAVEEMLRYDTPVQAHRRRPVEDVELHGVTIPADSTISAVVGSANRDERVFDDPDTFSLDRDTTRHMAFSTGIHYCPGAPVTRFEVKALFEEMLNRYDTIERMGPSSRWPQESETVDSMAGYSSVPVRLHRVD